ALAAVFARSGVSVAPQGQRLLVYPTPDAAYALRLLYEAQPRMLTAELTNPGGGAPHAQTLLYACLAEGSRRIGDAPVRLEAAYAEPLVASIDYDRQLLGDNLGYCGDGSSDGAWAERRSPMTVSVHGVLHDNT